MYEWDMKGRAAHDYVNSVVQVHLQQFNLNPEIGSQAMRGKGDARSARYS